MVVHAGDLWGTLQEPMPMHDETTETEETGKHLQSLGLSTKE
jgi:hypothetical protein